MEEPRILYTVREAAHLLRVGKDTVYYWVNTGKLKALKLNGLKIRHTTLMTFLDELENEGGRSCEC